MRITREEKKNISKVSSRDTFQSERNSDEEKRKRSWKVSQWDKRAMQAPKHIVHLPVELIHDHVLPYLSIKEWQSLDSSYTSHQYRSMLKNTWSTAKYPCLVPIEISALLPQLMWLHNNAISIDVLKINAEFGPRKSKYTLDAISWLADTQRGLKSFEIICSTMCNWLTDRHLRRIGSGCPLLQNFVIPRGKYTEKGVCYIARHCPHLRSIRIKSYYLDTSSLQALCDHCPWVLHIDIEWSTFLCSKDLQLITTAYPHLQSLKLGNYHITTDVAFAIAESCRDLRTLHFIGQRSVTPGMHAIWAANPNLIDVAIDHDAKLADSDIVYLVQCCPQLQHLSIVMAETITDIAMLAVAEHCPQLVSLNISFCLSITDIGIVAIATHCTKLTCLKIHYRKLWHLTEPDAITTRSYLAIGQLHLLQTLDIRRSIPLDDTVIAIMIAGCSCLRRFEACYVGDVVLMALANHCCNLEYLHVQKCHNISTSTITALARSCPLLEEINLAESNINDEGLHSLLQYSRNLAVLRLESCMMISCEAKSQKHFGDCRIFFRD